MSAESRAVRQAEENAVMAEIGRIISSSTDISEVYAQFGQVVNRLLQFDRISVASTDLEKGEVQTAYAWGIGVPGREPGDIDDLAGSTTQMVIQEDGAVVCGAIGVKESAHLPKPAARHLELGLQSFIAVPLRAKNETMGILQIFSKERDIYQDHHVRLLGTIADQISGAIANAQLYATIASSEVKLRDSEARLRAVLDTAVTGILTIDSQGVIESLNPSAAALFGYSADEVIGENVSILMPEPYHGSHHGNISNYLATGQTGVIGTVRELVGRRKNGSVFPMELSVNEIALEGRRSFTGIVRDITRRKQNDVELRQFVAIVESVIDPIIAIDGERRITVWNPAAEALYGYTREEALGETFELITPPHSMPLQTARVTLALEGQRNPERETQRITKSGEVIDVSSGGSPIFGEYGEVIGAVGIHRDITEQRRSERAHRESEERFNARLLEAKTRAEEIETRKTQQLQAIFEIAEALSGPTDFQIKAGKVAAVIQKHLDVETVALRMLNEEEGMLDLVATSGPRFLGLPDSLSLAEDGFTQRAFRSEQSVSIVDYSKEPDAKPDAVSRGLKSICSISLFGTDGPNGLVNVASRSHFKILSEQIRIKAMRTKAK
ncbi:MAG: hypothetical protein BZY87_06925 [SAR202 cluster bacterium Io17-Chloro-G6]|nr:MAG: hypothetical protein BZY87_06925 [SAR202 cluster bacterium Io17-Chloro-G6]